MIRTITTEDGSSICVHQPLDGDDGSVVIEVRGDADGDDAQVIHLRHAEAKQLIAWVDCPNDALVMQ